jgi:hypothetical protein
VKRVSHKRKEKKYKLRRDKRQYKTSKTHHGKRQQSKRQRKRWTRIPPELQLQQQR